MRRSVFYIFTFIILNNQFLFCYSFNKERINHCNISFTQNVEDQTKNDSISTKQKLSKARSLFRKSNFEEALDIALDVYTQSKNNKYEEIQFSSCLLIGRIFFESRQYERAVQYYRRLLNTSSRDIHDNLLQNDNSSSIFLTKNKPRLYFRLGNAYVQLYNNSDLKTHELKELKEKIESLGGAEKEIQKKTIETIKSYRDSAIYFFNQLERTPSLNNDVIDIKGKSYITLSALYLSDSLYSEAKNFANNAINIYKQSNDKLNLAKAHTNFASIFLYKGDFENAKKRYYFALDAIKNLKTQHAVELKYALYYNIAWAMRNLKDYKAYDNLEISNELLKNLEANETKKRIKQTELKHFESLKKLESDKEVEIAKIKKDSTDKLLGGLTILIVIVSAVIIYNIKLRQRNLKLKLEQSKLVEKQKIDHLKSEAQVKILNATIDGKETERKQIAETLHDSVSALLSSANMHLRATKKQFNGTTPVELEKTQDIILEASEKVRDLSHNLVSSILLKFGLEYAIKDIAKKYSNRELEFHTEISNVHRYSQEFEIKLYNVIHELVNNIIKHSKAANAYLIIEEKNNFLSVRIEDDGIGFNYKVSNSGSDGLGLNQIEARIQMMNGNFLVESGVNQGSKITFSVPVLIKSQTSFV
ncbi:Histidine kinase [Tenacibaculum sp. MAR_2009_124]|uniref:ATP-binding protein n=1 Tax=Tenacibaculum sp. MAR_2009_124 TaxID=1250059 RepID=UPI0008957EFB|nr:ATP-binding protein [Tenacibaculum sp. MAR_2009_124]SEB71718.1 Histidine kinase [Tenacibaculum sp. MAR_2009_124]